MGILFNPYDVVPWHDYTGRNAEDAKKHWYENLKHAEGSVPYHPVVPSGIFPTSTFTFNGARTENIESIVININTYPDVLSTQVYGLGTTPVYERPGDISWTHGWRRFFTIPYWDLNTAPFTPRPDEDVTRYFNLELRYIDYMTQLSEYFYLLSEPFVWKKDLSGYVHIAFRHWDRIEMGQSFYPFESGYGYLSDCQDFDHRLCSWDNYLHVFLPAPLAKPPFMFESTIEEVDGVKFVQKQISYQREAVEFFCSSYFANTLRLLWHCCEKYISVNGNSFWELYDTGAPVSSVMKRIDYMEPPEITWDDFHYCSVKLIFDHDTLAQTNAIVQPVEEEPEPVCPNPDVEPMEEYIDTLNRIEQVLWNCTSYTNTDRDVASIMVDIFDWYTYIFYNEDKSTGETHGILTWECGGCSLRSLQNWLYDIKYIIQPAIYNWIRHYDEDGGSECYLTDSWKNTIGNQLWFMRELMDEYNILDCAANTMSPEAINVVQTIYHQFGWMSNWRSNETSQYFRPYYYHVWYQSVVTAIDLLPSAGSLYVLNCEDIVTVNQYFLQGTYGYTNMLYADACAADMLDDLDMLASSHNGNIILQIRDCSMQITNVYNNDCSQHSSAIITQLFNIVNFANTWQDEDYSLDATGILTVTQDWIHAIQAIDPN